MHGTVGRRAVMEIAVDVATRTVRVSGELDHEFAPLLIDAAAVLLGSPGSLQLDLRAVDFLDAGGLSAMVVLARWQRAAGQRFVVSGPSRRIRRTIEIGGLASLLEEQ